MKDTSVLVIGGSRFVGPYLLDLLRGAGADITVFNRGTFSREYPNVTYIQGDRHHDFSKLDGMKFDVVLDMCAYVGADTKQLLAEVDFNFLVHFGTVASYGLPTTFPIPETHPQGEWFWGGYGSGKAECEDVLLKSGRPYASLRPTYILGEKNYMDRERFLYSHILAGKPLQVPGNGRALTQFVFANEVAEALFALGREQIPGAFNCVGDDAITLVELLEQMGKIANKTPVMMFDHEHDRGLWDDSVFPFANENFLFDNSKIKALGVKFAPLLEHLQSDWLNYYQRQL
jgi:nucleoside-diphosphate-sugar epimerase